MPRTKDSDEHLDGEGTIKIKNYMVDREAHAHNIGIANSGA